MGLTTEDSEYTESERSYEQNYLRATDLKVGLLMNFSHYPGVEHERFVI